MLRLRQVQLKQGHQRSLSLSRQRDQARNCRYKPLGNQQWLHVNSYKLRWSLRGKLSSDYGWNLRHRRATANLFVGQGHWRCRFISPLPYSKVIRLALVPHPKALLAVSNDLITINSLWSIALSPSWIGTGSSSSYEVGQLTEGRMSLLVHGFLMYEGM